MRENGDFQHVVFRLDVTRGNLNKNRDSNLHDKNFWYSIRVGQLELLNSGEEVLWRAGLIDEIDDDDDGFLRSILRYYGNYIVGCCII